MSVTEHRRGLDCGGMTVLAAIFVPVIIAVFAMQMERFETYCTRCTTAPVTADPTN